MTLSEKLQEIVDLAEAAYQGPWTTDMEKDGCMVDAGGECIAVTNDRDYFSTGILPSGCEKNAAFIASSRVLVPALARALGVAVKQLEMYGKGQHFEYCGKEEFAPENPSGEPANILCGGADDGEFQYEDGTLASQALAEIEKLLEVK